MQKHITESNHGVIDYMVLVNAKWWNGLPKDIRDGLTKAMEAATKTNNEIADKLNDEAKKKIEASGVTTIHQLTPAQRARVAEGDAAGVGEVRRPDRQGPDRGGGQKANTPKTN